MFHFYTPESVELKWVNECIAILWTLVVVGIITDTLGNQAYFTNVTDQNVLEKKNAIFCDMAGL